MIRFALTHRRRVTTVFLLSFALAAAGPAPAADSPGMYAGRPASYWIDLLEDEDQDARRRAVYALGQIRPAAREAVPALVRALDDSSPEVCSYAVDALGCLGPAAEEAAPAIAALFEKVLDDPAGDPFKRYKYFWRNAAKALGRIGPASNGAAAVLQGTLRKDAPPVYRGDQVYRVAAALALWKIAGNRPAAADARAFALSSVLLILEHGTGEGPYQACTALLAMAPGAEAAAKPAILALGHENPDVRRAAAEVVGRMGLPAAGLLTQALGHWNRIDRQRAAIALGLIADRLRRDVLYRPDASAREFAAAAGPLEKEIAPALVGLLDDDRAEVRRAAAEALAKTGPLVVPALVSVLTAENRRSAESARDALVRLERYLPPEADGPDGLERVKTKAVGPLTAAMGSDDRAVRTTALRTFAALSIGAAGKEATPLLREALKDQDVTVRRYAAKSLRRLQQQTNPNRRDVPP